MPTMETMLAVTWLNARLNLTPEDIAEGSPCREKPPQKPAFITYGGSELPPFIRDSRHLHRHWKQSTMLPIQGANHFSIFNELRAPDGQLTRLLLQRR